MWCDSQLRFIINHIQLSDYQMRSKESRWPLTDRTHSAAAAHCTSSLSAHTVTRPCSSVMENVHSISGGPLSVSHHSHHGVAGTWPDKPDRRSRANIERCLRWCDDLRSSLLKYHFNRLTTLVLHSTRYFWSAAWTSTTSIPVRWDTPPPCPQRWSKIV